MDEEQYENMFKFEKESTPENIIQAIEFLSSEIYNLYAKNNDGSCFSFLIRYQKLSKELK